MTSCECGWQAKCGVSNGKCKDFFVPGCWQGYDTWQSKKGKCIRPEVQNWYWRRTGTSYNSTLDTGPSGHPKANGFSNVLFEKTKGPAPSTTTTAGSATTSRSVGHAFESYETVLAVRKAMAYYEPSNFKKRRKHKWRHPNCRY